MRLEAYLEGLKAELERVPKDAQDAVRAEIKRVEALQSGNPKAERAARKQPVERTTAKPGEKRA